MFIFDLRNNFHLGIFKLMKVWTVEYVSTDMLGTGGRSERRGV